MASDLTISEVATRTGLTAHTLRYAGFPSALNGLAAAREVFAEISEVHCA